MSETPSGVQSREVHEKSAVAAIERIDQRLTRLEAALDRMDAVVAAAPGLVATAADVFDSMATRFAAGGVDLDARARSIGGLAERITAPETADAIAAILASGLLERGTLGVLGHLAAALSATSEATAPRVGAWGALRALGDPDVQRAVGFMLVVARHLGRALGSDAAGAHLLSTGALETTVQRRPA
jgi:hypothetical protein